jgi:hypothetical protein
MQINTMAMKITEKNWSVAAAILGNWVAGEPPLDSVGKFVVINTTARPGRMYQVPGGSRRGFVRGPSLDIDNVLFEAEDFNHMFDYDKRSKSKIAETFVNVTQINSYPIKIHPDQRVGELVDELHSEWHGEEAPE